MKNDPLPLALLITEYSASGGSRGQALTLAAQLGLLPDASFLVDGLERSAASLDSAGHELAFCLRAVPGPRLEPGPLAAACRDLAKWVKGRGLPADDPRLFRMQRRSDLDRHPLAGKGLTVNFHVPNLFYSVPPAAAINEAAVAGYQRLMDVFSMHVIAAQSTIDPEAYLHFCRAWWQAGQVPARAPFPERHLGSRVAAASRVVRRLIQPELAHLFQALTSLEDARPYHLLLQGLQRQCFNESEQAAIGSLSRLVESVVPGWHRPSGWQTRPPPAPREGVQLQREIRRTFADGYVRVSESGCISITEATDSGLIIELIEPRPPSIEDYAAELIAEHAESQAAASDENDAFDLPELPVDNISREQALAQAAEALDGQEWIPVDEAIEAGGISAVMLDEVQPNIPNPRPRHGVPTGGTTRWAHDQRRRFRFAHRLALNRINLADALAVLEAMMLVDPESEDANVMLCQHAALATGRDFELARSLMIHATSPTAPYDDDRIHYVISTRQWRVLAPAPAWNDKSTTSAERPRSDVVWLNDRTGFLELLVRLGRAVSGQPVRRLTQVRDQSLKRWLERQLPSVTNPQLALSSFLFYRLLDVARGDVALARLITGHSHTHGGSAAHYSHYPAHVVWHAYEAAWSPDYPQAAPKAVSYDRRLFITSEAAHGARRVPSLVADRRAHVLRSICTPASLTGPASGRAARLRWCAVCHQQPDSEWS